MLVLKIVFGIIVTLPILVLAEFLFEKVVEDALVGTVKKRHIPFYKRLLPKRFRGEDKREREEAREAEEVKQEQDPEEWLNGSHEDVDEWLKKEIERTTE